MAFSSVLSVNYPLDLIPLDFQRSEKVLVFGEKVASMPPGYPGGENLWAVAFRLIVEE